MGGVNNSLTDILFIEWQHLLQPFSVKAVVIQETFQLLVTAYSSPERQYHTLSHIHHVLTTINSLQKYTQNLSVVKLAAWFHDVVYDTRARDNEERSADYAQKLLSSWGIPATITNMVSRLVLNTKNHQADIEDIDSQVLLDADLGILAAHPEEYQRYAQAIRQEYGWMSGIDYILGRQRVLEQFLQRQQIYFTPLMFEQCENSARANIQAEIQYLQNLAH
ncbi:MAG: hypothetical protein QNJ51_22540 [Calothrix sp. MO_167.B12]|nr:hypothetical protein [Calothrix sp. MO_167.B12]